MKKKIIVALTVACSVIGVSTAYASSLFKDVDSKSPFYDSITQVANTGIMKGFTNGDFKPKDEVTREQLAAVLANLTDYVQTSSVSENANVQEMITEKLKGIVKINVYTVNEHSPGVTTETSEGVGSGFFIDKDLILTNYHVVKTGNSLLFSFYGSDRTYSADVVKTDANHDIALLKVKDMDDKNPFIFSFAEDSLSEGETIFTVGHPDSGLDKQKVVNIWDASARASFTLSEGLVAKTSRTVDGYDEMEMYMNVNPGNSGGPVFDINGDIVGMTRSKYIDNDTTSFAVKQQYLKEFMQDYYTNK